MKTIGLLGCGNVGRIIAQRGDGLDIVATYDQLPERADELARRRGARAHHDFASFLDDDVQIIVEAASVGAVRDHGVEILGSGRDFLVLSVGALAADAFRETLVAEASVNGRRIYIPSGAIFGLDNIKVGQISDMRKPLLRTTKQSASLGLKVKERTLLFRGSAEEGIRRYPGNVNVAVATRLAAGRAIDMELWADPHVDRNIHELIVSGEFGDAVIEVRNVPSPDNPATSYLAALSVLSLLHKLDQPLQIGT